MLQEHLGDHLEPLINLPLNRCTQATVTALEAIGFIGLSRIVGSDALQMRIVVEIPVTIDWLKKRHGVRLDWQGFCDYAAPLTEHEPVMSIKTMLTGCLCTRAINCASSGLRFGELQIVAPITWIHSFVTSVLPTMGVSASSITNPRAPSVIRPLNWVDRWAKSITGAASVLDNVQAGLQRAS